MAQPQLNIPFGLFYNILTCFDRRELCQLRNVNHRHYTVIENKFGATAPYLVFGWHHLSEWWWVWESALGQSCDGMPADVRNQLPLSKFIRLGCSNFLISSAIELVVLSINHVWENQKLLIDCTSDYIWNNDLTQMAAKAEYLDLETKSLVPYLRQLTSGNCVHLEIDVGYATLDDVELPWGHILDFLFKLNTEGIVIYSSNPSNHHRREMLEFLEQVKQKFLDSLVPVDLSFEWDWRMSLIASNDESIFNDFSVNDFRVNNRQTKQCLRFHSTANKFRLIVEQREQ